MPRGDALVALDTFVAPVTLDGRVPFHPRVLHHLQEGREGCQGRLRSHIWGPGEKGLGGAQGWGGQRGCFPFSGFDLVDMGLFC